MSVDRRLALVVATFAVLVVGCGRASQPVEETLAAPTESPLPGTEEHALIGLREFELSFPGSEEIARGTSPAKMTITGPLSATAQRRLGVNAPVAEVRAFFEQELEREGWGPTRSASGIRSTAEVMAFALEKDGVVFRFSVRRQDHSLAPPEDVTAKYETIYDIILLAVGDRYQ